VLSLLSTKLARCGRVRSGATIRKDMAEALCNGVVASPCAGDVGVAARVRGAAAALAESVPIGGYSTKSSFSAGRMAMTDRKARQGPRSVEAAPGQVRSSVEFVFFLASLPV
jgi:hypothetical protein